MLTDITVCLFCVVWVSEIKHTFVSFYFIYLFFSILVRFHAAHRCRRGAGRSTIPQRLGQSSLLSSVHETQQVEVGKHKPNPCCHGNKTPQSLDAKRGSESSKKENVSTFLVVCCHQ